MTRAAGYVIACGLLSMFAIGCIALGGLWLDGVLRDRRDGRRLAAEVESWLRERGEGVDA